MRNLREVLDQILEIVPFFEAESLWHGLNNIKSSTMTAAPEMMPFWWRETAELLADHFWEDERDLRPWQKQVLKIWTNN